MKERETKCIKNGEKDLMHGKEKNSKKPFHRQFEGAKTQKTWILQVHVGTFKNKMEIFWEFVGQFGNLIKIFDF